MELEKKIQKLTDLVRKMPAITRDEQDLKQEAICLIDDIRKIISKEGLNNGMDR